MRRLRPTGSLQALSGERRPVEIQKREHSVHVEAGTGTEKRARPRQVHVPEFLFGLSARHAFELAALLLANPTAWNPDSIARTIQAGRTQNVTLTNKVPELLAYWTAWVDPQGRVNFRRDVQGQDAKWLAGLAGAYATKGVD